MAGSHRGTRFRAGFSLLVLAGSLAACGNGSPTGLAAGPVDPVDLTFAPDLGVDLDGMTRTGSGLYLLDEVVGEGSQALAGDRVMVHYTGWFHDGVKFDSSVDRGVPFEVVNLGNANVIQGWNEGLQGMREGGRRLLVVPSNLAYGADAVVGRRWATLVFRIDMLAVEP